VKKAGFKAIVVTVDAPVAGKRERDERTKLDLDAVSLFRFISFLDEAEFFTNSRRPKTPTSRKPFLPQLQMRLIDHNNRQRHLYKVSLKRSEGEFSRTLLCPSANPIELRFSPSPATSIATQMFSYVDAKLEWRDIGWIKRVSGLPVVVKGIQTAEDAALAAHYGASAVYLSNHGGGYESVAFFLTQCTDS